MSSRRRAERDAVAHGLALLALAVALAVALAGCGGGDEAAAPEPGPVHVHGLGINPVDGALMIATHSGLWRVGAGERVPSRVGDSRQDTMGFTVVGPDHFLASGHPALAELDEGTAPHLGLIESRDGGNSWREVSLGGEADFHALRIIGDRLLALNARDGRLLQSSDDGASWSEVATPVPFFDIVASPDGRWLASAEDGLYRSDDTGVSWQRVNSRSGLLAWPEPAALYVVGGDGVVHVSADGGVRFARRGVAASPSAVLATDADTLFVAPVHDGTVYVSRDGGRSWQPRTRPRQDDGA